MAKQTRKRSATRKMSIDQFIALAEKVSKLHPVAIENGLSMAAGTRMWPCADGTWTARFVYRGPKQTVTLTMTDVVKGIVFP